VLTATSLKTEDSASIDPGIDEGRATVSSSSEVSLTLSTVSSFPFSAVDHCGGVTDSVIGGLERELVFKQDPL